MTDRGRDSEQDTLETDAVTILPVGGAPAQGGNGTAPEADTTDTAPEDDAPDAGPEDDATDAGPEAGTTEVLVGEVEEPAHFDEPGQSDENELHDDADTDGGTAQDTVVLAYEDRVIEALPEIARIAAVAWTRGAVWGVGAGLRLSARMARATVDPQTAAEIAHEVGSGMRSYAREFLGIAELEDRVDALTPAGDRFAGPRGGELWRGESRVSRVSAEVQLRAQGAELLRQSADVSVDDGLHPAFGRILAELAPDEGRILRLLAQEGPQPVVDVRAASLIGVGSQLVTQNLNMVAMQAGCRHAERVPSYLVNLQRLGLASFSEEPLQDAITYQVLEAQPYVLRSIQATSRAKTVHRSLRLTPFGSEFCEACFAPEPGPAQELPSGEPPASDGHQSAEDQ